MKPLRWKRALDAYQKYVLHTYEARYMGHTFVVRLEGNKWALDIDGHFDCLFERKSDAQAMAYNIASSHTF